jgi:hypothetical protein
LSLFSSEFDAWEEAMLVRALSLEKVPGTLKETGTAEKITGINSPDALSLDSGN